MLLSVWSAKNELSTLKPKANGRTLNKALKSTNLFFMWIINETIAIGIKEIKFIVWACNCGTFKNKVKSGINMVPPPMPIPPIRPPNAPNKIYKKYSIFHLYIILNQSKIDIFSCFIKKIHLKFFTLRINN